MPSVVFAVTYDDQTKQYYNSANNCLVEDIDDATVFDNPKHYEVDAIVKTIHLRHTPHDEPSTVSPLAVKIIANGLYRGGK